MAFKTFTALNYTFTNLFKQHSMKLEFVRKKLIENEADAFIVINHENSGQPDTAYISGFTGSESVVLVTADNQYIFVDGRYFTRVATEAPDFEMVKATRGRVYNDIQKLCKSLNINKLLIDPNITFYSSTIALNSQLPSVELISYPYFLHELRQIKTDDEIAILQESAKIACAAFNQIITEIKPGDTERGIAARLEFLMKDMGADKYSFDTIVASGLNGAFPHYVPSNKAIAIGELVTIDWGCYYKGYASDMTRTIAVGDVSDKLSEIYHTVKASQQAGVDAAVYGPTGIELDKVCRDVIDAAGYGEYFVHGTGHGLGLDVHELPYVNTNNDKVLPINSVVTIEPGIYIPGVGGVRIEDAIVIKEQNSINLNTDASKDLIHIS